MSRDVSTRSVATNARIAAPGDAQSVALNGNVVLAKFVLAGGTPKHGKLAKLWNAHSRTAKEREQLQRALHLAVSNTATPSTVLVGETSFLMCTNAAKYSWLSHLFSREVLQKLFVSEHAGNFIVVRATQEKLFEAMPLYARIGMHLLFYGSWQVRLLQWSSLRAVLRAESIRQGKIYDSTDPDLVRTQIAAFVETYRIDLSELEQPDLRAYKTFNEFFSRRLRNGARLSASPDDPSVIASAADCRLTVWPRWSSARKIWVKGREFTFPMLVRDAALVKALGKNPSLAIFRLAPQDYHRFHAPVGGTLGRAVHIPGEYYTVNPQAVNQRLDVFTANARAVVPMRADLGGKTVDGKATYAIVAIVAVGALLVGSIRWEKQTRARIAKGENLGYFQYGGSTVIAIFPEGVNWDEDLVSTSASGLETLVRVGERIGRFAAK